MWKTELFTTEGSDFASEQLMEFLNENNIKKFKILDSKNEVRCEYIEIIYWSKL